MHRILLLGLCLAVSLVTSAGAAPSARRLTTGQTECFDPTGRVIAEIPCAGTGQDGESQLGLPRTFRNNKDGTITDASTGLMWEVLEHGTDLLHGVDTIYDWEAALAKAVLFNVTGFAGHTNWRLPNVNELLTLAKHGKIKAPTTWPAFDKKCSSGCGNTSCSCTASALYWTSSNVFAESSRETRGAWAVDFATGSLLTHAKFNKLRARLVRTADRTAEGQPLRTGQTECWDPSGDRVLSIPCANTGQDGELRKGIKRKFVDKGRTILDPKTGLMWEKHDYDYGRLHDFRGTFTWPDAFAKIATLNATAFGGFSDWRLPNLNELQSLLTYAPVLNASVPEVFKAGCSPGCALPSCSCTAVGDHWTSTNYRTQAANSSLSAFTVDFRKGHLRTVPKVYRQHVRAVRTAR